MLQGGTFATEADARIEIFDLIQSYYNHHRKHSALGYLAPAHFKAKKQTNS
jgi:transposase InsO family protein